jgi:hypothetical protein
MRPFDAGARQLVVVDPHGYEKIDGDDHLDFALDDGEFVAHRLFSKYQDLARM